MAGAGDKAYLPPMPITLPAWRHFQDLTSHAESVSASASRNHSRRTLEVSCRHAGLARFAVTERRINAGWRWAIFSLRGAILGTGNEATQALAKGVAEQAMEAIRTRVPFKSDGEVGVELARAVASTPVVA